MVCFPRLKHVVLNGWGAGIYLAALIQNLQTGSSWTVKPTFRSLEQLEARLTPRCLSI